MKYVAFDRESGTYEWDPYFEYLRSQKTRFPADLYEYASNWAHYSLDDQDSLHDAWLQRIQLTGGAAEARVDTIQLEFLGAYHDRLHSLTYTGVRAFDIHLVGSGDSASRDLIVHEFRVEEDAFVHELIFRSGQALAITFMAFVFSQQYVPKNSY